MRFEVLSTDERLSGPSLDANEILGDQDDGDDGDEAAEGKSADWWWKLKSTAWTSTQRRQKPNSVDKHE